MVLIETYPHKPAVRDLDDRAVICRHARRRDNIQLRTDGVENIGFEYAFDDYDPGIARKFGETESEMERAA